MIFLFPWDMDLFFGGWCSRSLRFWGSGQHLWQPHATLRSGALMENTMTRHDGCCFFLALSFSKMTKNGWLSNNIWVSKDLGQAGVLKMKTSIQRDGLFELPFFVWNLVGATDILPWLFMYLGAFVCTENFHLMNGLGLFPIYICSTAIESAPFYMAGPFQSIVRISGANHCRGIFPIACLVIGVFWSWSFIP